ncbi:MAG TPA: response regulator [Spirochaetota bacterium]|nr:response regulator [Spirochaetota bacterium]
MKKQKSKKILLVDDNPAFLLQLKWALKDEYKVETATSCSQAHSLYLSFEPDMILLDLYLDRNIHNYEETTAFLTFFKQLNGKVKVVIVTSEEDKRVRQNLLQSGADDYLTKTNLMDKLPAVLQAG